MKSWIWIVLIVLLLVVSLSIPVFAASVTNENICPRSERSCVTKNFADEDNDGICDNHTEQAFADACGIAQDNRANFVDQDNDGVCDNRGSGMGRQGRCRRQNG